MREVALPIVTESRTWGSSSKTCRIVNDICPTTSFSVFIKDQVNGDQKRLRLGYDGKPTFKVRDYATAWLVRGDTVEAYDSWMR